MADPVGIMDLINSATNSGDARMRLLERRFTGELPRELPSPKSLTFEAHNAGHRRAGAQPDQAGNGDRACLETGALSSCSQDSTKETASPESCSCNSRTCEAHPKNYCMFRMGALAGSACNLRFVSTGRGAHDLTLQTAFQHHHRYETSCLLPRCKLWGSIPNVSCRVELFCALHKNLHNLPATGSL